MLKVKREGGRLWIMGTLLGQRVRKSTGLAVGFEKDAEIQRIRIEREIAEGRFGEKEEKTGHTFGAAVKLYLQWRGMENKLSPQTERLAKLYESLFGGRDVRTLTQEEIQRTVLHAFEGLQPSSVRRYLNVFNAIMNHAASVWGVKVAVAKRPRADDERDVHWTGEEASAFLEWCQRKHAWAHPHFLVLVDCGVRLNELLQLHRRDFEGGVLRVRRRTLSNGKTEARTIPLTEDVQKVVISMPERGPAFLNRHGEPFWNANSASAFLGAVLKEGVAELGLREIRLHDLRHTFAYLVAQAGADLGDLQLLMGHSDIKMTMRYRGFVESRARAAVLSARSAGSGAERSEANVSARKTV
jgi:integrase